MLINDTQNTHPEIDSAERVWLCLRAQPKREHIAERNLRQLDGVEVFNPRLRTRKVTRRGPVWFTESLFTNYIFARFHFQALLEEVKFTPGVHQVVHFGDRYPTVPDSTITELRAHFGNGELQLAPESPQVGDRVTVTDPKMFGLKATVLRVIPARERVQVLLEMLGTATMVELSVRCAIPEGRPLPAMLRAGAAAHRERANHGAGFKGSAVPVRPATAC